MNLLEKESRLQLRPIPELRSKDLCRFWAKLILDYLPQNKICSQCEIKKSIENFHFDKRSRDGLKASCIECRNKYQRETQRYFMLKCKYYITELQYELMLKSQKGVCKICSKPETTKRSGVIQFLTVDHDHKTHKIRGLLCRKCNLLLGQIEKLPNKVQAITDYLKE